MALEELAIVTLLSLTSSGGVLGNEYTFFWPNNPSEYTPGENLSYLGSTDYLKLIDHDNGVVQCKFYVEHAEFTDLSLLFLLRADFFFTPGAFYNQNGYTQFDPAGQIYNGSVDISLRGSYFGPGKDPIETHYLTSAPRSSSFTTTVTSAYNTTINQGIDSELSIEGGYVGVSTGTSRSLAFNFSKTVSTTSENPVISFSPSPDGSSLMWSFNVTDEDLYTIPYQLSTVILFEMSKSEVGVSGGIAPEYYESFLIDLDVSATMKDGWWWSDHTESKSTTVYFRWDLC